MAYPLENALFQWEEGHRRLEERRDSGRGYRRLLRTVAAIEDELRRRIGPTFSAAELAQLYGEGTDWCTRIAIETAPGDPEAWDSQTVADAAFYHYLRGATDFAGGRRIVSD
ncbi:MAG: hypothetical protein QOG09_390 [Solirubrobacterales bacterium]|jgi:hypothetical protein|nr:hypothetical protein [Solirubrobacterales bacterium]